MSAEKERLDEKDRCCGRKPIVYRVPSLHYFCTRCDREFDADKKQRGNWAWKKTESGFMRIAGVT